MSKERILGAAAVVGLLAATGVSIEVWQKGDEIDRELNDRVAHTLPGTYSPKELLGYRLVISQYDQAVAGGNIQAVKAMRTSGEIDMARVKVEDDQLLQAERGRLRIELGKEDSGILGISKVWMRLIRRLALAVPLTLIAAGVASFFASRQARPNSPSTEQAVPGILIRRQ